MREVDFLIQGAGIGGLTLAVALARKGYTVHLLERNSHLSEVGAGIWMAPNAMQVFAQLGLADQVIEAGWPVRNVELCDSRGILLQKLNLEAERERFGFDSIAIHRARLQKIIAQALPTDAISFGCEIEKFNETPEGVEATDKQGRVWRALYLIGADGLRSEVRRRIFPDARIRYSGSSSYRAISHQPRGDFFAYQSREIWAPGCRLGFSAISNELVYWYMTFDAPAGVNSTAAENFKHASDLFRQYFPSYSELLRKVEQAEKIIRTDISDLISLRDWSRGRIILIGDAAHATTPNLGQGGAQAVEDAFVLSEEMMRSAKGPYAINAFIHRRWQKANWIVRTSWSFGRVCHLRNPLLRGLRNAALAMSPVRVAHRQLERIYTLS